MAKKHVVLGSKAKLWGSPPEIIGGVRAEPPVFGDFCIFLIKIPHFEAHLSLNFYKNIFLSL